MVLHVSLTARHEALEEGGAMTGPKDLPRIIFLLVEDVPVLVPELYLYVLNLLFSTPKSSRLLSSSCSV